MTKSADTKCFLDLWGKVFTFLDSRALEQSFFCPILHSKKVKIFFNKAVKTETFVKKKRERTKVTKILLLH